MQVNTCKSACMSCVDACVAWMDALFGRMSCMRRFKFASKGTYFNITHGSRGHQLDVDRLQVSLAASLTRCKSHADATSLNPKP